MVVESSRSGYVESDISLVAIVKGLADSRVCTKVAGSRRRLGEVVKVEKGPRILKKAS